MRLGVVMRAAIVATAVWLPVGGFAIGSWRLADERQIYNEAITSCKNAALQRNDPALEAAWDRCYLLLSPGAKSPEQQRFEWLAAFSTAAAVAALVWLIAFALSPLWRWIDAGRGR